MIDRSDPLVAAALAELKTDPYDHQLAEYLRTRDEPFWGHLFEQRCGKSKVTLDEAAHLYRKRRITALLIIAPNGVHLNWVKEEIPRHLADDVDARAIAWRAGRMGTIAARTALRELLKHHGLRVLAVNVDALTQELFRKYLSAFYVAQPLIDGKRAVMAVWDESLDGSNPAAKRTEMGLKIGARSAYRRILDGTAADAKPTGLFSQCEFLRPGALGYSSFVAFRARYAKLERRDFGERDKPCPDCRPLAANGTRPRLADPDCLRCAGQGVVGRIETQVITGFQNLEELRDRLASFTTRVTRADCADLPDKVYTKAFFELTPVQRRAYEELREEFLTEIRESTLTATHVLTRILRLQQLTSNFAPEEPETVECGDCRGAGCEACDDLGFKLISKNQRWLTVDEDRDPRLEMTLATVERAGGAPGLIWAWHRRDLEALTSAARSRSWRVGAMHGGVAADDRERAKRAFQDGSLDVLVLNPRSAGRGIDLARADWCIYHSNSWPLRLRRQSEDRAQSLAKRTAVLYTDVVATGTVDEKIIRTLREGRELADEVMGDPKVPWI